VTLVGELDPGDLAERLGGRGLAIACGGFVPRITSTLPGVVAGVRENYADHPIAGRDRIVDSRVIVRRLSRRRPWRPRRVTASVDESEPFVPVPETMAIPMLETALNFAIASRGHQYLVLHAGVVAREDGALLLVGASGSGKTTLSAALAFAGWRLLSDEMALVRTATGMVEPVPRPISLKNESIAIIRHRAPEARIGTPYPGTPKGTIAYARPPRDSLEAGERPARPAWIVFPRFSPDAAPDSRPVSRAMAFMRGTIQSPNYVRLGATGFRTLADLVERCPAHDMSYGRLDDAVDMVKALAGH
jgi:hypothetical protein